ncbi:MAG: N-acetylmuramoyl-L-alanine amidase [Bacilli bacterium]|nr:N-acetylmuramoyl-L-alanine amidase [Bacilli bacterium]
MKKLLIGLLIFLVVGCTLSDKKDYVNEQEVFSFANDINTDITINKYTIYGRFFNLEGETDINSNLTLVLKNNDKEIEYPIYREENKTKFTTNEKINDGINLESIEEGTYVVLLKSNEEYYNLKDASGKNYKELEYYTITCNKKNYKITISFENILDKSYLILTCKETKLPNDIYDIVIDPGHGGVDVGAISGKYKESTINLEYSLLLKEELESLGLKIKLTRNGDTDIYNYGEKGRVSIPYKSKAKLLLSIHLNSANLNVGNGGIEVYIPSNSNLNFAKSIASQVVENTSTIYSKNSSCRVEKGVYLRTLTKSDLEELENDAKKDGYTPYERATTNSTYYYMLRETGGVVTGAYIDGRNPKKPGNPYYNSNHGCESYLVELGYLSSSTNLNILLSEKEKYVEAIVEAIKEELKNGC